MKPDQYTTLKPYKTSLKDTPKVGGLKEKDGWVNMQVASKPCGQSNARVLQCQARRGPVKIVR